MKSNLDKMISLSKSFSSSLDVSKDLEGKYLVSIYRVSYKENNRDIMSRGICGRSADSLEMACRDFLQNASGKILFGDDKNFYGENRPEFICLDIG